jgi:hypothetical protein
MLHLESGSNISIGINLDLAPLKAASISHE